MIKCLKCGREIGDEANFCRYCGEPTETKGKAPEKEKVCPQCRKKVPASAKFCRYCGNRFAEDDVSVTAGDEAVTVNENYITWHILPGQLAVKIDEKDIEGYGRVKGLYVVPGTQAMFFMNGKYVTTLESGKYAFKDFVKEGAGPNAQKRGAAMTFLQNIARHIKNGIDMLFGRNSAGEKIFYSVVLVKGTEFPLLFTLNDVRTANIRSEVGLHILCRLNDVNAFYHDRLVDKKFVSLDSFADHLITVVKVVLDRELSALSPEEIQTQPELFEKILNALCERFQSIYPYLSVTQVIDIAATQEELEYIRQLKEDLYIAEKELEQTQLREDFLNKMQNQEYGNALRSARSKVDFEALMDRIDESGLLNEEKKAQFVLMLRSERLLREARTETETQNAIDGLLKSRLLSEEEVETLRRTIKHRADMQDIGDEAAIAMATLYNAVSLDREKLNWEMEIGNKRLRNELDRQRLQDEYADERRNADLEFRDRSMAGKMDLLRQAQALREEREQAQHQRDMEARKLEQDAELEHQRIAATMSFEQIMASNPSISPDAAAALAKKFEAEALAAQNDKTAELVRQHDEDLKNILSQQMNLTRDIIAAQDRANADAIAEKQRELDRVHADSERHQDRMLSGMQTTVEAVSNMGRPQPASCFCPNCGRKNSANAKKCEQCGSDLT